MHSISSSNTSVNTAATPNKYLQLSSEHREHIAGRGLLNDWTGANCHTEKANNARGTLGYPVKSDGIMFWGENNQCQFRPDTPWESEDGSKPKYRTRGGKYDALILRHPTDSNYWEPDRLKEKCWKVDGHPCILLSEGGFKAISGCSNGIPTIALLGVENGLTGKKDDVQGKGYLVPALKKYAEAGLGFIIAFDADKKPKTVENVSIAEKTLALALKEYNVPIYTVTGHWNVEDGKGMDDFIQNKGVEEFRKILEKATAFSDKKQSDRTSKKPPTPRETAALIGEQYGHQWKYDNEQKEWRVYSGKHWEKVEIGNFETLLMTVVDAKNIAYSGDAYLTDVLKLLTKLLREKHWGGADRRRFINFSNCVLDGSSGKTREHQPGDRFTSYLPFEHKPLAGDTSDPLQALETNCPNINTWMRMAMRGDAKKIFKLLAIINGCLRFGFHGWQQFVHLIGAPGSGKGTFARLMEKVVGKDNTQPCALESLKDGSTLASIIDKQLVVFGDERKPVGVESILRLTGGDSINYREVYRPAANAYFYGLLLICSNDPIFMGNTTGLERRLCLVEFNNPVPKALRNSEMEASFDSEIASLIAIALSLPSSEVKQAIQGIGDAEIADFKAAEWDMKMRMDSLAAFFEMELIVEDGAQVRAGDLFDSYKDFCEEIKKPAMSLTTFSPGLEKLCAELHLPVTRDRSGRHVTFIGLRMRGKNDYHPTYSQQLAALCRTSDSTSSTSAGLAGLPPIQDIALQDLQDLSPNILEDCESDREQDETGQGIQEKIEEKEITPTSPASPANPLLSKVLSPAQSPAEVLLTPPISPASIGANHKEFKIGDRVEITLRSDYQGQKGEIVDIGYGSAETDYYVRLEKERVTVTVPRGVDSFPYLRNL
jgi:putative DNA primase/helicase